MRDTQVQLFVGTQVLSLLMPLVCTTFSLFPMAKSSKLKSLVSGLAVALSSSLVGLFLNLFGQNLDLTLTGGLGQLRFDFLTALLLPFINLVCLVILCFSGRYLVAEQSRLSFLRYCTYLGSTAAFLLCSDNMFLSLLCWHLISIILFSIVMLNPGSRAAAATIIRSHLASDILFMGAVVLIYFVAGTCSLSALCRQLSASPAHQLGFGGIFFNAGDLAAVLFVLSFSIKSALFPFHRWLLCTLEAPTPLSGLLHAGVVNVSAIMAIRLGELLGAGSAFASFLWGILSLGSAIAGTLAMSAQFDVKRKLVYSTVGQMGFMSLQCALGAYPAALFHLVAHGFFKCHMFLLSGSAVDEGKTKSKWGEEFASQRPSPGPLLRTFLAFLLLLPGLTLTFIFGGLSAASISLTVLAALALLFSSRLLQKVSLGTFLYYMAGIGITLFASVCCIALIELKMSAQALAHDFQPAVPVIFLGFLSLASWLFLLRRSGSGGSLYVHALNGFYIDEMVTAIGARRKARLNG